MSKVFAALTGIMVVGGLILGVGLAMWQSGTVPGASLLLGGGQVGNAPRGQEASAAQRTPSRGGPPTVSGVVESASEDSVTVRTSNGTTKVALAVNTTIRKSEVVTPGQINPGDAVLVMGSRDANNVVTAWSVQLGQSAVGEQTDQSAGGQYRAAGTPTTDRAPGNFGSQSQVAGTVDSAAPDKLVVKTATGSMTVTLSSQTILRRTVAGSWSDLAPGIGVVVMGQPTTDGSVAATSIQIQAAPDDQGSGRTRPSR